MNSITEISPQVSIIIVSYCNSDILDNLLNNLFLLKETIRYEILVVDNFSDDGSVQILRKYLSRLTLIENTSNKGFAVAVNQAASIAQGDAILLLNPDVWMSSGILSCLYEKLQSRDSYAAVAPKILNPDGSIQPSRGSFPSITIVAAHLLGLKHLMPSDKWIIQSPLNFLGGVFRQYGVLQQTESVDYTTGACVLIKKSAFECAGGMDERFFLYYEEIDLAMRMKKKGYEWIFLGDLEVRHSVAASSRKAPLAPFYHRYRSMVQYFRIHQPGWKVFLVRQMIHIMAAMRMVVCHFTDRFRIGRSDTWQDEKHLYQDLLRL